jgi:hypothetical protein
MGYGDNAFYLYLAKRVGRVLSCKMAQATQISLKLFNY